MRRAVAFFRRLGRFARALYRDERTPRWAKRLFWATFLPTPFEIDEVIRAGIVAALWFRYRELLRETWAGVAA